MPPQTCVGCNHYLYENGMRERPTSGHIILHNHLPFSVCMISLYGQLSVCVCASTFSTEVMIIFSLYLGAEVCEEQCVRGGGGGWVGVILV